MDSEGQSDAQELESDEGKTIKDLPFLDTEKEGIGDLLKSASDSLNAGWRYFKGGISQTSQSTILVLIFLIVFTVYYYSPVATPTDSRWVTHTALSILKNGTPFLDEYKNLLKGSYLIEYVNGHPVSTYPIGVTSIVMPFVFIIDKISGRAFGLGLNELLLAFPQVDVEIEVFIASFITALAAMFIYLIGRFHLDRKYSLLLVFIFAFCTSAWSTASRALWSHGPSMLMLSIALYIILLARDKPWVVQFASLPLILSFAMRPTNALPILVLTIYIFIKYRQYFVRYFHLGMAMVVPFLAYNLSVYNALIPSYYLSVTTETFGTNPHFLEALAGTLISPSRGLFIFSPILLLSVFGVFLKIKKKQFYLLDYCLIGVIILHWIGMSSYSGWWGGHAIGPRYFTDMLPYLMYFLIPVLAMIPQLSEKEKTPFLLVFLCLIGISFFVHYVSSTEWEVWRWNTDPLNVDQYPSRIWDWNDIQFMRGVFPHSKVGSEVKILEVLAGPFTRFKINVS